jgi:cytosine/adenosine deaminase-related metal-dependent hydrolase
MPTERRSPVTTAVSRTVIKNGFVITMDDELGIQQGADVVIAEDGSIEAIGPSIPANGAEVVDATNCIVIPGFVDTHRHMYSGLARATGDGLSYGDYFHEIVLGYAQHYLPDDTYVAVRLGMAEAIESGITTMHAWEHNLITPEHADASLKALTQSGLRGRFSYGPPNVPMSVDPAHVLRMRAQNFHQRPDGRYFTPDGRIELGMACRGIELDDESIWKPELEFARAENLPITGHFMAPEQIDHLYAHGALGPDLLGVHAVDAGESQVAKLAETGTPISISHGGNGRAGVGWSNPVLMRQGGVSLCISLDSLSGCDSGDFFTLMRMIVVGTRAIERNPEAYPVLTMLREATLGGAEAIGIDDVTGSLTPGKRADVVVLRTDTLNMTPLVNPVAQVVLSAQPRNVHHVWIDGVPRMKAGSFVDYAAADIVAQGREQFAKLTARIGKKVP